MLGSRQPRSRAGAGGCGAVMIFVTSSLRRNAPSPDAVVSGMARSALAEAALGSKGSHNGSVIAKGSFLINVMGARRRQLWLEGLRPCPAPCV